MSTNFHQKCRTVTSAVKNHSNNSTVFKKHVRFQGVANVTTICDSDKALNIEDLEQNLKTLKKHPRTILRGSQFLDLPTARLYNRLGGDVLARGDFTVYQGCDLNDFFGESVPQRVSEVCLVNDHYILVKMPETCWRRNSQIECIVEEVKPSQELQRVDNIDDIAGKGDCGSRKFAKYFQCNRSIRVAPMQEELVKKNMTDVKTKSKGSRVNSCWNSDGGDSEVFQTVTKIHGALGKTEPHIEVITKDPHTSWKSVGCKNEVFHTLSKIQGSLKIIEPHVEVITKQPIITKNQNNENISNQKNTSEQSKIKTISTLLDSSLGPASLESVRRGNKSENIKLQTSVHDAVQLEHHGSLETLQNGKIMEKYSSFETSSTLKTIKESKSRRRFIAFRWLLKPFRSRSSKGKKPKSKLHAVIYKTYFVRWKRPPETIWHGYGLRRPNNDELSGMPKLRRCRSAIF